MQERKGKRREKKKEKKKKNIKQSPQVLKSIPRMNFGNVVTV